MGIHSTVPNLSLALKSFNIYWQKRCLDTFFWTFYWIWLSYEANLQVWTECTFFIPRRTKLNRSFTLWTVFRMRWKQVQSRNCYFRGDHGLAWFHKIVSTSWLFSRDYRSYIKLNTIKKYCGHGGRIWEEKQLSRTTLMHHWFFQLESHKRRIDRVSF